MENINTKQGTASFRPRARLMHTVGDDLISDESVAIIELVKNAYDADASHVYIEFISPLEVGNGSIIIVDDGHGMSLQTILDEWMQPATSAKLHRKQSPKGRRLLGEKGIGRFAAWRLANELELITRAANTDLEVRALFDWTEFDRKEFLDEVAFLWEEGSAVDIRPGGMIEHIWKDKYANISFTQGTILQLSKLQVSWTEEALLQIRASLSRLISGSDSVQDFSITLVAPPEYSNISGTISPPDTIQNPNYTIEGKVNKDGGYNLVYTEDGISKEIVGKYDLGRDSYCGSFEISIRVWDRDDLDKLAEKFNLPLERVKKDLNQAAGVSVYRDKFRVLPYGEPHNDWLRLDIRRVQNPTMRVSNNQVVGKVIISADSNPALQDQTNREGLKAGQALTDFRELIRAVIHELEKLRYISRHREVSSQAHGRDLFEGIGLQPVLSFVNERYKNDKELRQIVEQQERFVSQRVNEVKKTLARYSRLATLGQLIDVVLHDGRTYLEYIGNEMLLGLKSIGKGQQNVSIIEKLAERFVSVQNTVKLFEDLFKRIEPFSSRVRGRIENVAIEQVIDNAIRIFSREIQDDHVRITMPQTHTFVRVVPGEIQQIFVNLVQNSLFWLKNVPKGQRAIQVDVTETQPGQVEIQFSDSGPGIPEDYRDKIFDLYFSGKPDGSGQGLAIAGEIAAEYDGNLELITSGSLSGACFVVTIKQRK